MPAPHNLVPKMGKQYRVLQSFVYTVVFLAFILPLGFILDRPSVVHKDREEGFRAKNQWLSAAFHVALPLFVLGNHGVWGFAFLPLMVLVVARRLSASRAGAPYLVPDLYSDVTELLQTCRARVVVLVGTAVTLLLQTATLIWPFMGFLSSVAATVVWGTWIYLASAAAGKNVAVAQEESATRDKYTVMLSKAFTAPAADWADSEIVDNGAQLTVTSPPLAAVLHYSQANAVLALIAPEWEANLEESNHEVLVLDAASEETVQRRAEEANSGGLIGGRLSDAASAPVQPARTGLVITADELV